MGRYRAIYTENQNGDGYEAEKNKTEKNTAAYTTMQDYQMGGCLSWN